MDFASLSLLFTLFSAAVPVAYVLLMLIFVGKGDTRAAYLSLSRLASDPRRRRESRF